MLYYLPHRNLDVSRGARLLHRFSIHRADRMLDLSGKSKVGGVRFIINNSWCDRKNAHPIQPFCSPDLEYLTLLCRPFWLPREFTAVVITAVYIPPQADTDAALKDLYGHLCKQETVHLNAAFIITVDFNRADLRRIAIRPLFHSAPACLQAEVEKGNTQPQDNSALVGPIRSYVTGLF